MRHNNMNNLDITIYNINMSGAQIAFYNTAIVIMFNRPNNRQKQRHFKDSEGLETKFWGRWQTSYWALRQYVENQPSRYSSFILHQHKGFKPHRKGIVAFSSRGRHRGGCTLWGSGVLPVRDLPLNNRKLAFTSIITFLCFIFCFLFRLCFIVWFSFSFHFSFFVLVLYSCC
jgi:hypothetical protein